MDRRKVERTGNANAAMYVLDIKDLVQRVWQRKALTIAITLLLTLPATVYLLAQPKMYRAASTVMVENHALDIADIKDAVPGIEPDRMTIDTQVKVIGSTGIIRRVIDRLGLRYDNDHLVITRDANAAQPEKTAAPASGDAPQDYAVRKVYAQRLNVAPVVNTRIIEISYIDNDPKTAAAIVNAHTREYVDSEILNKRDQAEKLNAWLSEQVKLLKEEGEKKSSAVQKFREESGMVEGRNSEELIYQEISSTAEQLMPIESRRLELRARYDGQGSAGTGDIAQSNILQSLKIQASTARQDMQSARSKYGVNHPTYREAQKRAQQAEADLKGEMNASRAALKTELETVTNLENSLQEKLAALKTQADALKTKQITLQSLELEADTTGKLLNSFLARYEQIASQIDFARADVRIVSLADAPLEPVGSKNKIIVVLVMFLSAMTAIAIALALSLLDGGITTAAAIRRDLGLRLMGVLPKVRDPFKEISGQKSSVYLEQLKRLYLQITARPETRKILVTSAMAGEGKSAVAQALASYITKTQRTALVIEIDSSSPESSPAQGGSGPGLADVLAGRADISAAIRPAEGGANVLALGDVQGERFDLLASPRFLPLLETLKSQYDYILLDTAPVLSSTDAEAIAGHVDQVVMVIASGKTKKKKLKKAADTLRQFAREMPYAILNKAPVSSIE